MRATLQPNVPPPHPAAPDDAVQPVPPVRPPLAPPAVSTSVAPEAAAAVEVRECMSTVPGCARYEVSDRFGFIWGVDILTEMVTPDMLLYFRLYYEANPRTAPPASLGLRLVR